MSGRKPKTHVGDTIKCPLCPRIFSGNFRNIDKLCKMHIKQSHGQNAISIANTYVPEPKDNKAFVANLVNHMSKHHKEND